MVGPSNERTSLARKSRACTDEEAVIVGMPTKDHQCKPLIAKKHFGSLRYFCVKIKQS